MPQTVNKSTQYDVWHFKVEGWALSVNMWKVTKIIERTKICVIMYVWEHNTIWRTRHLQYNTQIYILRNGQYLIIYFTSGPIFSFKVSHYVLGPTEHVWQNSSKSRGPKTSKAFRDLHRHEGVQMFVRRQ